MRSAIRILDVDVDAVTLPDAIDMIAEAIDARLGHGGPTFQVATVNPEFVMLARRDPAFRRTLRACALRTADGAGLMLAARLLGRPLPQRVTGVDLVEGLATRAASRGDSVFLLGAAPGVAEAAASRLIAEHPGLVVAGTLSGHSGVEGDHDSVAAVRASGAKVLLVAFGAPAQEAWAQRNLEASGAAVSIGVGGTFDFLAGRVRRAPALMRRLGLEWLFRLVQQPWRVRRMAVLPVFLVHVLGQRWGAR
ncbi:MAG: WecB/TagA/CpsF family glycosyltransferase [Candidatus Dormibacteria bacterium]